MKRLIEYIFYAAILIFILIPNIAWFLNDHLTSIQVLKQFWYYYLSAFILSIVIFLYKVTKTRLY